MQLLKTVLVIALGLGSVWAARQIAPAPAPEFLTGVAYAQSAPETDANQPATGAGPPATNPQATQDPVIEKQLAEIDAVLAKDGEIREFKPKEPLPTDMAIEMSSEL